jgi:hypothetical protein
MKKIIFLVLIASFATACVSTKKATDQTQINAELNIQRDGSSFEKAIIIKERNEKTGVDAEYFWLRQNYPGYKLEGQSLVHYKHVPYDIIEIVTVTGEKKSIYFNISKFFGKF